MRMKKTNMVKCRICLKSKARVCSIFDTIEGNTFAFMMTSLARIKIGNHDETNDIICFVCRRNLVEAFKFKVLIESSDKILHDAPNTTKIYFDNLQDIKIKIEICDTDINKENPNLDDYFKDGEIAFTYNNTIIKKRDPCEIKIENETLSIVDLINNCGNDDSEFLYDDSVICDDFEPKPKVLDVVFELPSSARRKPTTTKKKKVRRENTKLQKVLIKPVIRRDIEIVHRVEKKAKQSKKTYQKLVMCYYCGKMSNNINRHLLNHTGERSHKCDICLKAFLTDKDLLKHQKTHSEKSFKCDNCVAAFTSKQLLQSHMNTHSEQRQFVCDICQKSFKRKGALRRHKLVHSIANKTFKCDLCNMSFFSRENLRHHLRVHTGERPYNCELCSQPYSYKHDFNRHCFKKHGVFLKRRSVNVMNEEVLVRERALMRDLMLRIHGIGKIDSSLNPFEGPQAALAFQQAVNALETKKIPIDYSFHNENYPVKL